jgi:hypothetical protein
LWYTTRIYGEVVLAEEGKIDLSEESDELGRALKSVLFKLRPTKSSKETAGLMIFPLKLLGWPLLL